jgi:SAM-dependent methyltransferase
MKLILIALAIILLIFGLVVLRGAPYVPSKRRDVRRALKTLYPLDKKDVLIDIGSGDGIVLREAAKHGARAVGYELNPILVGISRFLSRRQPLVSVRLADFWLAKFPDTTTVVYVFGESRDITRMAARVQGEANRLGRPLAMISYGFALQDRDAAASNGSHYLYRFEPLHAIKP